MKGKRKEFKYLYLLMKDLIFEKVINDHEDRIISDGIYWRRNL